MYEYSQMRPTVFIGSSTEGLNIAEAIQQDLVNDSAVTLWTQGFFPLGKGMLEALNDQLQSFDFAVLILTPDDVVVSRGEGKPSPRDNVLFELGLFIGAIGRERSFIVYDQDQPINLPSDLAGVTAATFRKHHLNNNLRSTLSTATYPIKEAIRQLGPRQTRGDFVLCIPTGDPNKDEFNRELKFYLMEKLVAEGIKMLDYCPSIDLSKKTATLWNFREKIKELAEKECPRYLLVIWPGLCEDGDRNYVLTSLRQLANRGCRIGFINERPEIEPSDSLNGKVFSIRSNMQSGIKLLCGFIKKNIGENCHVLLISAAQGFQVAQKRKELYERLLKDNNLKYTPCEIPSWDEKDAYDRVIRELKLLNNSSPYDVIAAANDDMAIGATKALLDFYGGDGKEIKTKVVGFDGLNSAKNMILKDKNSPFVATIADYPRSYALKAFSVLCKNESDKELIPIDADALITKGTC